MDTCFHSNSINSFRSCSVVRKSDRSICRCTLVSTLITCFSNNSEKSQISNNLKLWLWSVWTGRCVTWIITPGFGYKSGRSVVSLLQAAAVILRWWQLGRARPLGVWTSTSSRVNFLFWTKKKLFTSYKFLITFYLHFGFIIKLDKNQRSDFLQHDVFNQSWYWLTSNSSMVDIQSHHRKTRSKWYQTDTGTIVHAWKQHI